jgi:hypothetical protein
MVRSIGGAMLRTQLAGGTVFIKFFDSLIPFSIRRAATVGYAVPRI